MTSLSIHGGLSPRSVNLVIISIVSAIKEAQLSEGFR